MDPLIGAALIQAGGGIAGGALDLFGGLLSNNAAAEQGHKNRKLAQWMFKNQARVRVQDLRNAGLNPVLAANSGLSAQATNVPSSPPITNPASGAGRTLAQTASNIGDAILKADEINRKKKMDESTVNVNDAQTAYLNAQKVNQMVQAQEGLDRLGKSDKRFEIEVKQGEAALKNALATNARTEAETSKIVADTNRVLQQLDQEAVMHTLGVMREQKELALMDVERTLMQQTINHNDAKLALAKISINLESARTQKDLEKADAEIHLLYRKAYGAKLDDDLKRYQMGVRFDANKERFLRAAERITGVISKLTGAVTSFSPRSRLLNITNHY